MQRPHIITIAGKPGSGKSTTADKVADLLSYTRHSSGDLARTVAKRHGMSLSEFNKQAGSDRSMDDEIDTELRKLRDEDGVVIDSRLGFYWIPDSFKVYLDLDIDVATARIFSDATSNIGRDIGAGLAGSIGEVRTEVEKRLKDEQWRFKSIYKVDPYDEKHFDLIVDTSRHSPQTVALAVFDNYKKWLQREEWKQVRDAVPLGYSMKNDY